MNTEVPHNDRVESWLLMSIFHDPEVMHRICLSVSDTDFYRATHGQIFRAMRRLYDAGTPIDAIAVDDCLIRDKADAARDTLTDILDANRYLPIGDGPEYHAAIVRGHAQKRRLMEVCGETFRFAADPSNGISECLELATSGVFGLAAENAAPTQATLAGSVLAAIDRIHLRKDGHCVGLPTGFADLDDSLNGLAPGSMTIIAARPSMGKTAIALQIADNANAAGHGVLFVSLEMSADELGERLIIAHSQVNGEKVRAHARHLNDGDLMRLGVAYDALRSRQNFTIDDAPIRTPSQIAALVRQNKLKTNTQLVVVDYLQLVDAGDAAIKHGSRQEQVAYVSRMMKAVAKECGVAMVLCAQLNRQADVREDHRPRLSDLRESGQIEQDADLVIFLHRPEYYDPNDSPGVAELIIAKNRNGNTGIMKLAFRKQLMRFENLSPDIVGTF